jgi:transcriptional regulator with XRE-family HTH domain
MKNSDTGTKISDLRKAKGLTQQQLAELCSIDVRTLQRIEAGKVQPRAYTVNLMFEILAKEEPLEDTTEILQSAEQEEHLQRSRTRKMVEIILIAFVLIAGLGVLILTKCSAENVEDCVLADYNLGKLQTSFITEINVHVENVPQRVKIVKLVESTDDDIFSEEGTFENGTLRMSLPKEMLSKHVYFILRTHTGVIRSNKDVRFAFAKLEGYDEGGNAIGVFEYRSTEEKRITTLLLYAERDVTLVGKDNSEDIWFASLKEGWNKIFHERMDDGTGPIVMTTTHPNEDMKWRFRRYD